MRELSISEVQNVSGGYGTLGPGGGSDPGNQLNDYGVDSGGLRYINDNTRHNIAIGAGTAVTMSQPIGWAQRAATAALAWGGWNR